MNGGIRKDVCATGILEVDAMAPGAFGMATLLRSPGGAATAYVIVGPLPEPSSLGMSYYVFLVVDPRSGEAVIRDPMVTLPEGQFGANVWGGTASADLTDCPLPCGSVMVFAADIEGSLGPQVASGQLADGG